MIRLRSSTVGSVITWTETFQYPYLAAGTTAWTLSAVDNNYIANFAGTTSDGADLHSSFLSSMTEFSMARIKAETVIGGIFNAETRDHIRGSPQRIFGEQKCFWDMFLSLFLCYSANY
jgi:hypothetical protein